MYYLLITISALLFSLQFLFNDGFQKENGNTLSATLKFSVYTSVIGCVLLLFTNHLKLEVSVFSLIVSIVYSLIGILLNYASIQAFSYANLSVYSIFAMLGGMVLPFLYGLLKGEDTNLLRIMCCVFITIALFMTISDGKHSGKAVKYYVLVFVLNGMVGVVSSFHQSYGNICVDSSSFLILTKIITTMICIALMLMQSKKDFAVSTKSLLFCGGHSVFNSVGNLFLLISLLHLPTSVQYPIVTGGTIVFSTIIDKLRGISISKKEIFAALVALISSVLMAM